MNLKPYTELQNHQQIVYNLADVVQKDFFSVDFHAPAYFKGVENFITERSLKTDRKRVSDGVEISAKSGERLISTRCTYCHAEVKHVKNSFVDIMQLGRVEDIEGYKAHTDWLLSFAPDNPWAGAVTQLIILKNKETDLVEAIIQPTVKNCPDKLLYSNFIIALRQGTEGSDDSFPDYKKYLEQGYSRRAAFYLASKELSNTNHTPFSYMFDKTSISRYLGIPTVLAQDEQGNFTPICNKACWCEDGPFITTAILKRKEMSK